MKHLYVLFLSLMFLLSGCSPDFIIIGEEGGGSIISFNGTGAILQNATITTVNENLTTIEAYYDIKQQFVNISIINTTRTQINTNDNLTGFSIICIDSSENVTIIGDC